MHTSSRISRTVIVLGVAAGLFTAASAFAARAHHRRRAKEEPPPVVPLSQVHVYGGLPAPFVLNATAAELIETRSGAVLYAYNEHVKTQPASLAKMMTFYLTLQALREKRIALDTEMPVSEAAWRLSLNDSVSRMFLQVGQKVPVHDLLYGLMVSSGNDAAVVLSEYLGGSTAAFTDQMNKEAAKLGMTETHFTNPDGLPTPDEYTTAADMVKLGRAIVETFPEAKQFTSAKDFSFKTIGPNNRPVTITQRNFNTLLFYDSRVNGIKTGHVQEAGYHLVASATSDDLELISAVFGTTSMEKRRVETDKLLDWAFRSYTTVSLDWRKAIPPTLRVYGGDIDYVPIAPAGGNAYFTIEKGMEKKVALVASVSRKPLIAPLPKGAAVGELTVMVGGKAESSTPIVTQQAVAEGGLVHRWIDSVRMKL